MINTLNAVISSIVWKIEINGFIEANLVLVVVEGVPTIPVFVK